MPKNDPKDPLVRSLVLLGLIPRYPKSASVQELKTALEQRGYSVTARTLQRDLSEKLSTRFPLICQDDGQAFRWSFDSQAQISLPATDTAAALAMNLAEGHLKHLLPPGVLALLEPQFATARNHLQSLQHNPLTRWAQRVRSLPNGKALLPASVDAQVWEQVANALLEQRQLRVDYLSRVKGEIKTMTLHPKGMVSRGPTAYLVASVGNYEDVRHFALHRIQKAQALEAYSRDENFDMDTYLPIAAFTPRQGIGSVELVADIDSDIAWILRETPISKLQNIEPLSGRRWFRLTAEIPNDQETLWWLLGLGSGIRVLAPATYVETLRETSKRMTRLYEHH